jgi:predicted branched-subunit amino acid permease
VTALADHPEAEDSYAAGVRAALPLVLPTLLIGASFGVAATTVGWGVVAPVVMSAIVFSGAAQFAIASVLGGGGSVLAAVLAGTLVATRFLAAGAAIGPSMRGGPLRRALEGQAVVDASLVLGRVGEGRYGPRRLLGSSAPQYVCWTTGTLIGVLAGERIADPEALGLDAVFPAFFVSLVVGELNSTATRVTAAAAAAIVLVLIPVAPPGVPVIAACAAVLAGRVVATR